MVRAQFVGVILAQCVDADAKIPSDVNVARPDPSHLLDLGTQLIGRLMGRTAPASFFVNQHG